MNTMVLLPLLILLLCAVLVSVIFFGRTRWQAFTRELRSELEAARLPLTCSRFDPHELESLPSPVRRYFRTVLTEGQAMVAAVRVEQTGTFNLHEEAPKWLPCTATQRVTLRRPGFDWDARITMMPGLCVFVHDAYIAGEGILRVAVIGLVKKADLRDQGELARGELMRFFAEAPWYPTALLPSQGVAWSAVDDHSALATLKDGTLATTLLFRFNPEGTIASFRAEARGRSLGDTLEFAPWEGRFWNYALRDGMKIPMEAEVAWILPSGAKPYCRLKLTKLSYDFEL